MRQNPGFAPGFSFEGLLLPKQKPGAETTVFLNLSAKPACDIAPSLA